MSKWVDRYWRVANYLTVESMYLKNGCHKLDSIQPEDLRDFVSGHWGTCPGINFIYAHLCCYINKYCRDVHLVVGPGHAGNALMANYQIESDATDIIDEDIYWRTEINPSYPGVFYAGGELGYSLAISFGAVLDVSNRLCVCIIGDGEAETGTIAAAWRCKEFMDKNSGFVLPILHLNGYKMGGPALIAKQTDAEICEFFYSLGYEPIVVKGIHADMAAALDFAEQRYCEISEGVHNRWPAIILKTPKGWTAPDYLDIKIENSLKSHKDPLKGISLSHKAKYISRWLKEYDQGDLFDSEGNISREITNFLPPREERLSTAHQRHCRIPLKLPSILEYGIPNSDLSREHQNITVLKDYLSEVIRENTDTFRIVSPDELESNLLGTLSPNCFKTDSGNRVLEILNENICQAWMQGYLQTGRNCLFISYESFMPIITSMIEQYAKWIYQTEKINWRYKAASATYILTSVCWENTYSHQNPSFLNTVLSSQYSFVRVFTPPDANSLLTTLETCLKSENKINIIITSKQRMPQWLDVQEAKQAIRNSIMYWDIFSITKKSPDITVVSSGDYPTRECVEAIRLIKNFKFNVTIRLVFIFELTALGSRDVYPESLSEEEFCDVFGVSPIVFSFHGYPSALKALLFERIMDRKIAILGYDNKSICSEDSVGKLIANKNSRFDIAIEICRFLFEDGKISIDAYNRAVAELQLSMKGLRGNGKNR